MNLENYNIINHQINFNDPEYNNLQNLLNSDLNKINSLNHYLNELLYLRNNWDNTELRNSFIENKLGGYWDWEGLAAYNVTGNWFTSIAFDDLNGYINADTKCFYLENTILVNEIIMQMQLDEFIDVLQQWKVILMN